MVDRGGQVFNIEVRPEVQPDRYGLPGTVASAPVVVGRQPGININVPGVNMVVPGPNIDIGPPAAGRGELVEPPLTIPPQAGTRPPIVSQPADAIL